MRLADWRLLVAAWWSVFVTALGLRLLGYGRLAPWIPVCRDRAIRDADRAKAAHYARWIEIASRRQPLPAACLAQSLTLLTWLRREGVPCVLQIGVAKAGAQFGAHAWVELDGSPVNDTPRSVMAFTPLAAAPTTGALLNSR